MKKLLSLLVVAFLTLNTFSQFCPALGPDQFLPCGVGSTTLTADLSQCVPGANPNGTSTYNVTQIPYVLQNNTGTLVQLSDDSQSGILNIGFNFCFFGQIYTQFRIGSNGWVSLGAGAQPTTFTSAPIPNGGATIPKNCVMGPWQDWNPGIGGQIRYQVQGTAPCRKLVVSWINIPMFSCTNVQGTFHTVLYESTNIIENHIATKPNCLQWAGGTAVQGLHNLLGNIAFTVPGRNSTQWTALNDARRYTPAGPPIVPTLVWYQVGVAAPIAQGVNTITVTPPVGGAQYTCHFEYPLCNAGWSSCNNIPGQSPDTVLVVPGPPNLSIPTTSLVDPTCNGYCDGQILITPSGGTPPFTISWTAPLIGLNPTGVCAGTYTYSLSDVNGCSIGGTVVLTDPPPVVISPIVGSDTVCFGSNNEFYSVQGQAGYSYLWQSLGTITTGQGSPGISVDWSSTLPGYYTSAVQVQGFNQVGCNSQTEVFNLTVYYVDPAIDQIGPFCSVDDCVPITASPLGGTLMGTGVNGSQFCPQGSLMNNNITYTYTQSGCTFEDSISVTVNPNPSITQIDPQNYFVETCDSAQVTFNATVTLPGTTVWNITGDTVSGNPASYTWFNAGVYTVTAVHTTGSCVSQPLTTTVTIQECPALLIYIPNTFTPDGDEHNHVWQPEFTSGHDPYRFDLVIFNRWGESIFESRNPTIGWDGIYANRPCPQGVYTYMITYGLEDNGRISTVIGHVNLIR